jgi:hypothetical protein
MRTYLLLLACGLLILGQYAIPTTAGPYLENSGESFILFYLHFLLHMLTHKVPDFRE